MRFFVALALLGSALASTGERDAILWNVDRATMGSDVGSMVSSASKESTLVMLLLPSFSLGDFSAAAAVYGAKPTGKIPHIAEAMRKSGGYFGQRVWGDVAAALEESASEVLYYREVEDAEALGDAGVVVLDAADWAPLDAMAKEVLAKLPRARVVLVGREAQPIRAKRASATDAPSTNQTGKYFANDACPSFCGGAIVTDTDEHSTIYSFPAPTQPLVSCDNNSAIQSFTYNFMSEDKKNELNLDFTFANDSSGYWVLGGLNATLTIGGKARPMASLSSVNLLTLYMSSIVGSSYACGETVPAWFVGPKKKLFSLSLVNFQVSPFPLGDGVFTDIVDDCVPFFTIGIWMGLFSGLILLLTLIFGLAMISSLQTMDKFDDPKGKPLHINAKE